MKWYSGDIAEAIRESKSRGSIFVVYIESNGDDSNSISSLFENGILGKRLDSENFVAIKIQAGSLPHHQFSEFYKDPSIPSVYFIGKDGNPLDIIKGTDDLGTLSTRIDCILSKAGLVIESVAPQLQQSSDSSCDIVCENDICRIVNTSKVEQNEASTSSEQRETRELTPEEKVERAKEILEAKRKHKEKEEEENQRMKELERRKMGQSVQELKRWQKEQELKQLLEEREKEKLQEKLARERVLAQIKQDKEERLSKSQPLSPNTDSISKPITPFQIKSGKTRLQFKLPDGSSNTQEFLISDTLQTVTEYIKDKLKLPFNSFKLSTTFPRREFTSGDYSQTLLDLQLCPNAVILILPQNNGALITNNVGGTLATFFWSIFGPIFGIFDYLKGLIFGKSQNTTGTKRPPDDMGEPSFRPPNTKKRVMRDSTVVRRQGNIHRLTDRDSSDDEGNTWNGNSTQQM